MQSKPGSRAERPVYEVREEQRDWLPTGAFVFVVLALIALAAIPTILLHRISQATDEITSTILPAYDRLRELSFATEERISSARSRFLSGDPSYDLRYAQAQRAEDTALRELEALVVELDSATLAEIGRLRETMAYRDSLVAAVLASGGDAEAYASALPQFDAIRDSMLAQLDELRQDLVRVTATITQKEARWIGLQQVLSALLVTLALVAAMTVAWSALHQRRLRHELVGALADANRQRALAIQRGDDLERAADSRVRLLRGITHDVKNPLGAAKGYAELLQMGVRGPVDPEQAPLIQGVTRSIDGALTILTDLLDLARVDSGGFTVHRTELDLRALTRMVAQDHRLAAEGAGHTITVHAPEEPLIVHTDPARVEQVLGNLLSNAIKYTPAPGKIEIVAEAGRHRGQPRPGSWVTITVSDNGPGIPEEHREAIFDEFTRLHENRPQKGHGLGLAIARRIARLLGGDLTVEEAPGGGAAFVLWIVQRELD